jgi:ubiquinone/menaquinone biosynthesis C-methylase UbiE
MKTDIKDIYENISNHFNNTRYKVWDCVKTFLDNVPKNSYGLEIGCGNGKNMLYRNDINMKGIDICNNFVEICKKKNLNVIQGDMLNLPYNNDEFDFIICIAVLHHLDTKDKRIGAIKEMFRVCKNKGKIFILVWDFNQDNTSRRKFKSQDELVSWFCKEDNKYYDRYYHLYIKDELIDEIKNTNYNFNIINYFNEKNNWGATICKK